MKLWKQSRLPAEAGWVLAGQIGVGLAGLLGLRLITKSLAPEVYGTVALYVGAAALLQNLFCSPLIQGAFRFHPEMRSSADLAGLRRQTLRDLGVAIGGLSALVVIAGIVFAALKFNSFWPFLILPALVGIEAVQSLETNLLSAARRQKFVALWRTASAWMRPLAIVVVALALRPDAGMALGAFAVGTAIPLAVVLLGPFRLEGHGSGPSSDSSATRRRRREIFRYAAPLVPLALMGWTMSLGDRYLLAGMLGAEQVAIYAAAYGLVSRPFLMLEGVFTQTLLPHLNRAVTGSRKEEERQLLSIWLGGSLVLGAAGWLLFDRLAGWIVPLLLAEEYRAAAGLVSPIALGMLFLTMARALEWRLYAHKRTGRVFAGQALSAAISLAAAFVMIGRWGTPGAAMAVPVYTACYLGIVIAANRMGTSAATASNELASPLVEAGADS